ncbi:MAG: efflux RND transporter permease subunit [Candidatus Tenebribacter davisii]|nr:efflux RND transporter permease subunit [Candidatus Tenebribacter davisii]
MSIANFSVKNPVLINIVMVIVFVLGAYTIVNIPKEEEPEIDFGMFVISVTYPGVSPSDIETEIIDKIEEELADLDDVESMESSASEGRAIVSIDMDENADLDDTEDVINREMNKITDLPEDASDITVTRINTKEMSSICSIVFSGNYSENGLREIAENLETQILQVENVSSVEISGTREREIVIDADTQKMENYGISFTTMQSTVAGRNSNVPGGSVYYDNEELTLRSMGEYNSVEEIENTVLKVNANGSNILISDVATVKDTLEESETISKLDMNTSVTLTIYKKEEGNIIKVVDDLKELITEFGESVSDIQIGMRNDGSVQVENSLNTLGSNAVMGILMVFIVLWMFIGWKNALFAAWGLPFSFLLTFIIMNLMGITINTLSLFALILVLGMIVDDAIIVLENIQRKMEQGMSVHDATITGVKQIIWPVIAAVLTTISAFIPLLLMEGHMGKFLALFPVVVTIALTASLIECLLVLPSHVVEFSGKNPHEPKEKKGANKLTKYLTSKYQIAIKWALSHRRFVMIGVLIMLISSLALVATGKIRMEFFPQSASQNITLNLKLENGAKLQKTNEVTARIEDFVLNMEQKSDIESIVTNVGQLQENHQTQTQSNYAEMKIDFIEVDDMTYSDVEIKNSIREFTDKQMEIASYSISVGRGGPPTGEDLELRIIGNDMDVLKNINSDILTILENINGLTDIESSLIESDKEVQIIPNYDALKFYGFSESDVAALIRTAAYGTTISTYRGSGSDEIDITLKANDSQVEQLEDLKNLKLVSNSGVAIPLYEICEIEITNGFSQIEHYDSDRYFMITGSTESYTIDGKQYELSSNEVNAMLKGSAQDPGLLSNISEKYAGYQIEYGGSAEQQEKTYDSLAIAFFIALLLVYAILGTQFKSYIQPVIVMTAIPFGIIGVIFGLWITGLPISLMTMIAFVALSGIVVNDSLVLVDFVNKIREDGLDRWNSLIEAGSIRLRPILMTTTTTIAGFMPMILSNSSSSDSWKPMAVAIAFGLGFATLLTLFVLPVIYSLVDSLFGKLKLTKFKQQISYEDSMKLRSEMDLD